VLFAPPVPEPPDELEDEDPLVAAPPAPDELVDPLCAVELGSPLEVDELSDPVPPPPAPLVPLVELVEPAASPLDVLDVPVDEVELAWFDLLHPTDASDARSHTPDAITQRFVRELCIGPSYAVRAHCSTAS
jgi:hypothetical protein